jgi:hypothetical protein
MWNLGLDGLVLHGTGTSGTLFDYSNTMKRIRHGQYVGGEGVPLNQRLSHRLLLPAQSYK